MSADAPRLVFIDALKAFASQLVVLHHLAFYGPMSDRAQELIPGLITWLYDDARMAVQTFLVIGGFLAAQALTNQASRLNPTLWMLLWRRYLKLVLPYLVALLCAILAAAFARHLIQNEEIPAFPSVPQLLAHLFLLQGILGFDGLSAGVWYVAIDFQLYALLLILVCWRRGTRLAFSSGVLVVAIATFASLFYFNRNEALDNWACYFFGAYGLGALTYWGVAERKVSPWLLAAFLLAVAALVVDYRVRIALALLLAVLLSLARYFGFMASWPKAKWIAWLGQISYSIFLVHYPVSLVVNAVFERFAPHAPLVQLGGLLLAWISSLAAGALFYNYVECRSLLVLKKLHLSGSTLGRA